MNRLTSFTKEELKCPKCGKVHMCDRYSVINVTEKPELKEKVLKNEIFSFSCEECGLKAPLTYESVYVDSKKHLLIYLAPEMTDLVKASISQWEEIDIKNKRLVDNINDLKEKIIIADQYMDDRIIEFMKIENLRQLENEMKDDNLMNILFDSDGVNYYFLVFFERKGIGRIPIVADYYRGAEKRFQNHIGRKYPNHFLKADMEWANQVLLAKN